MKPWKNFLTFINGWSTDPSPIVTTCGEWKDGRGRFFARVSGEKYIPAADLSVPLVKPNQMIFQMEYANLHKYRTFLYEDFHWCDSLSIKLEREKLQSKSGW